MNNSRGFTLIEIMVTIAILGILALTAIPTYRTLMGRAVGAEATTIMKELINAEIMYYLHNDRFFPDPGFSIAIYQDDHPGKPEIQQVNDALKVTLPVGHYLDFLLQNPGPGGVIVQIDASLPLFKDGSRHIHTTIDQAGNVQTLVF